MQLSQAFKKIEKKKIKKPTPKRKWPLHSHSGFMVLSSQTFLGLLPQRNKKEERKSNTATPHPPRKNHTNTTGSKKKKDRKEKKKKRCGERPFLQSPVHLSTERHSWAQPPTRPLCILMFCLPPSSSLSFPLGCLSFSKAKSPKCNAAECEGFRWVRRGAASCPLRSRAGWQAGLSCLPFPTPHPSRGSSGLSGWHALHPVWALLLVRCV